MIFEQSRQLRSAQRKNIREIQIKRIKDNIRQTYVERQSRIYEKKVAICKICQELQQEGRNCYRSINQIAYDSLVFHEGFCQKHEREIIEINLEKCLINFQNIWKPYCNINWDEATLSMVKRSLNFLSEVLVSLNSVICFDNGLMVEALAGSSFVEALLNETIEYVLTRMQELEKVQVCYLSFLKKQANLCVQLIVMNFPMVIMGSKDVEEILQGLYERGDENRNVCMSVILEVLKQERMGNRIERLIRGILEQILDRNYSNVVEVKQESIVLQVVLVQKLLLYGYEWLFMERIDVRIEGWLMSMKNVISNLGFGSRQSCNESIGNIGRMICGLRQRKCQLMEQQ